MAGLSSWAVEVVLSVKWGSGGAEKKLRSEFRGSEKFPGGVFGG